MKKNWGRSWSSSGQAPVKRCKAWLKASYVPNLSEVLPMKKAARYLQVEKKVRALVKYELAGIIPLVR